jgi:hypothetical protein
MAVLEEGRDEDPSDEAGSAGNENHDGPGSRQEGFVTSTMTKVVLLADFIRT